MGGGWSPVLCVKGLGGGWGGVGKILLTHLAILRERSDLLTGRAGRAV